MITDTKPVFATRQGDGTARKALQASAGKCVLSRIHARNLSGADIYLQFHDLATTPADGVAPSFPAITIPAGTTYESDTPRSFVAGCYICASSTIATKTLVATDAVAIAAELA